MRNSESSNIFLQCVQNNIERNVERISRADSAGSTDRSNAEKASTSSPHTWQVPDDPSHYVFRRTKEMVIVHERQGATVGEVPIYDLYDEQLRKAILRGYNTAASYDMIALHDMSEAFNIPMDDLRSIWQGIHLKNRDELSKSSFPIFSMPPPPDVIRMQSYTSSKAALEDDTPMDVDEEESEEIDLLQVLRNRTIRTTMMDRDSEPVAPQYTYGTKRGRNGRRREGGSDGRSGDGSKREGGSHSHAGDGPSKMRQSVRDVDSFGDIVLPMQPSDGGAADSALTEDEREGQDGHSDPEDENESYPPTTDLTDGNELPHSDDGHEDGTTENGATENGATEDGVTENGATEDNGATENDEMEDGTTEGDAPPGDESMASDTDDNVPLETGQEDGAPANSEQGSDVNAPEEKEPEDDGPEESEKGTGQPKDDDHEDRGLGESASQADRLAGIRSPSAAANEIPSLRRQNQPAGRSREASVQGTSNQRSSNSTSAKQPGHQEKPQPVIAGMSLSLILSYYRNLVHMNGMSISGLPNFHSLKDY